MIAYFLSMIWADKIYREKYQKAEIHLKAALEDVLVYTLDSVTVHTPGIQFLA